MIEIFRVGISSPGFRASLGCGGISTPGIELGLLPNSTPFCLLLINNKGLRMRATLSLNYFLLYGDVKVHWANLIFIVRV